MLNVPFPIVSIFIYLEICHIPVFFRDDTLSMGLFSRKKSKWEDIMSSEDLVKFWRSFTTNLVYSAEFNAKKAGLDIFGSPITKHGVFGLKRNHVLAIILNSIHEKNLLSVNANYPVSINEASSIIVRLGPLWIESIHGTYINKSSKLASEVNILEVVLVSLPTVCAFVELIDRMAEIPEDNSAEMEKELMRLLSFMMDNKQ